MKLRSASIIPLILSAFVANSHAAPNPLVQGRDGIIWWAISDNDHSADQDVTMFGNVNVGSSKDRRYRLHNTTDGTLQWEGFTSQDPQFTVHTTSGAPQGFFIPIPILGGGGPRDFIIRFTPTSSGETSPIITLQTNAANLGAEYTFRINGVGQAPEARIAGRQGGGGEYTTIDSGDTSPRLADGTDFGFIPTGGFVDRDFQLSNEGNQTLDPGNAFFVGGNSDDFSINGLTYGNLGAENDRPFSIRFEPSTTGVKTTTLHFVSDDPKTPLYTFALRGEAVALPNIRVRGLQGEIPTDIDDEDHTPNQQVTQYGSVVVGSPGTRSFRILNEGNGNLHIDSITSSNPDFTIPGPPTFIAADKDADFVINFTPSAAGPATTIIEIESDSPGDESRYTFALSGTGIVPDARIRGIGPEFFLPILDGDTTPRPDDATDFGFIPVGSFVQHEFEIHNDGTAPLDINSTSFDGPHGSQFSVSGLNLGQLGAGKVDQFTITFQPTTPGVKTTTFWLVSDDPDENPYDFVITGEGVAFPNIRVRGEAVPNISYPDIDDDDLVADQDVTDFGNVGLGQTGTRTYRIVNEGNATLNITSITTDNSRFTVPGPPTSIFPDKSKDFVIDFTPTARSTVFATVTIESDSPGDESTYTFGIKGTGQGPEIVVEGVATNSAWFNINNGSTGPDPRNGTLFRDTNIDNDAAARSFRIRNTGDKNLRITGREFTGSGESHFSVSGLLANNPFADIGPGGSRTFTITFDPSSAGSKLATFEIDNNDANEDPFAFQIGGTGVARPVLELEGRSGGSITRWNPIINGETTPRVEVGTEFTAVPLAGDPIIKNFRITNSGDGVLSIASITSNSADFRVDRAPTVLTAGQSAVFNVIFDPVNTGFLESTITISSDGYDPQGRTDYTYGVRGYSWDNVSARIRAGGISSDHVFNGQLNIQGFSFGGLYTGWSDIEHDDDDTRPGNATDFGTHPVETPFFAPLSLLPIDTHTHFYRIWNEGGEPMIIDSVSLTSDQFRFENLDFYDIGSEISYSGDPAGDYRYRNEPIAVGPGEHITLSVRFDPDRYGGHDAQIIIDTSSPTSTPAPFHLNITGFGDSDEGPELSIDGDDRIYRFRAPNGGSHLREYTIFNIGSEILTINSITSNDPARFTIDDIPAFIPPGQSAVFTITYHAPPTGSSVDEAVLTLITNDTDDPQDFPFSQTLVGQPGTPELSVWAVATTSIPNGTLTTPPEFGTDFGIVPPAGPAEQRSFLLRNDSAQDTLTIDYVTTSSPSFLITGAPTEIPPGGEASLNVRFLPLGEGGTEQATLQIHSDDPDDDPYKFALTGTAPGPVPPPEIIRLERSATGDYLSVWFTGSPDRTYRIVQSGDLTNWDQAPGQTGIVGSWSSTYGYVTSLQNEPQVFVKVEEE